MTTYLLKVIVVMVCLTGEAVFLAGQPRPAIPPPDRVSLAQKEWTRAKLGIQEYLDAMPEEGMGFKPTPEIRSFAEQMLHIASANYMFASAASGQPNPYDAAQPGKDVEKRADLQKSKAALREFVLDSYDYMLAAVRRMEIARFDDDVTFFNAKMPRSLLLAKAIEHHAHHRGQTAIYLRLKGVTPPSERLF